MSVTGLLTGTSTQTSATGLILQPLRCLSTFQVTQTAHWWHQLAMLTSSRCLHATLKMGRFPTAGTGQARGAESLISARGASRGSAPRRASANPAGRRLVGPRKESRILVSVSFHGPPIGRGFRVPHCPPVTDSHRSDAVGGSRGRSIETIRYTGGRAASDSGSAPLGRP